MPSPYPNTETWSTELANRLGEPQLAGNNIQKSSEISQGKAPETGHDTPALNQERILFHELKSFPNLRKSLALVNFAKSYEYGLKTFEKNLGYLEIF